MQFFTEPGIDQQRECSDDRNVASVQWTKAAAPRFMALCNRIRSIAGIRIRQIKEFAAAMVAPGIVPASSAFALLCRRNRE